MNMPSAVFDAKCLYHILYKNKSIIINLKK